MLATFGIKFANIEAWRKPARGACGANGRSFTGLCPGFIQKSEKKMEISQIRSSMPFMFPTPEKESAPVRSTGDIVDIQAPQLLADDEVEGVLADTISMIGNDPATALSVHSGLSESRVFALLGL